MFQIVKYPKGILKVKTKEIVKITEEHRKIFEDMLSTMYKHNGIGLAAPQVGLNLKMAVVDTGRGPIRMANPVIVKKDGLDAMDEGCLSVPSAAVKVVRAENITVKYMDEEGSDRELSVSGLAAKAIQHEIDHLNGYLIIDYLPWYKRIFVRSKKK